MEARQRIWVALDLNDLTKAASLIEALSPHVGGFKVGLELLTAAGAPQAVEMIRTKGAKVFFDGKFHDIPNTVAGAVKSVVRLGVEMFTVHASAGPDVLRAAAAAKGKSKLLAVTVLTSHTDEACRSIFGTPIQSKVLQFAREARDAGADGIVCSPQELELLGRDAALAGLQKVTPGVRPKWAMQGDQTRTMTPAEAVERGADFLVIGRPILSPPAEIGSPVEAVRRIVSEIAG